MEIIAEFLKALGAHIQSMGDEKVLLLSIFVLLLIVWLRVKQLLRRINEVSTLEKNREQLFVEGEAGTHRQLIAIQEQLDRVAKQSSSE